MIYFLLIIFFVIALTACWGVFSLVGLLFAKGVPYVPLSKEKMKYLQTELQIIKNKKVVDLGCGDGRVLRMFEKMGAEEMVGYEINLWACLIGKIINRLTGSKAKIHFRNFKKVDLSDYEIIFCYLLEGALSDLREKLIKELNPNGKIISYGFPLKSWSGKEKTIYADPDNHHKDRIFIYTKE